MLVACAIAFAILGSRLRVSYRTPLSGCAFDNGTGGASGLYRWCERLKWPVMRLEVPLREAPSSLASPTGNVAFTMGDGPWSPADEEPDPAVWRAVRDWLARGNALVVVTGSPGSLPEGLRDEFIKGKLDEVGRIVSNVAVPEQLRISESVDRRPETSEAPAAGGGVLVIESDGPRWNPVVPKPAPTKPASTKEGPTKEASGPGPGDWRLAGDPRGGVLYRFPVGQGACCVLLSPFAWTNAGLDAGDNARILAGILRREARDGGVIAFDEHRHGHGRPESFLTFLLGLPGASAFLWLALAWALLYYYARNVRLRPVEPLDEPERRTTREYMDAVAQLNERARAAPLAVAAVAGRLRQVARSSVVDERAVGELLREADAYVESGDRPASPRRAIRLVREMVQLRKRLYGSRTVP